MKENISRKATRGYNVQSSSTSFGCNSNITDKSPVERTPLSNISNAAEARMARKLILNKKRSRAVCTKPTPAEARKARKLILQNKKSRQTQNSSCVVLATSSSNYNENVITNSSSGVTRSIRNKTKIINPEVVINDITYEFDTFENHTRLHKASTSVASSSRSRVTQHCKKSKLSKGKGKLKNSKRSLSPVRMLDLTSDDVINDMENVVYTAFSGISQDYSDHGDQLVSCELCNAKLWTSEAGRSRKIEGKKCFMLCCNYGRVQLPDHIDAPQNYHELFLSKDSKSRFFLKNIRRFNSMFCFTSMGGKIDKSVNKGPGPYAFRISGQNFHSIGSLVPEDGCQPKFQQLYIHDTENEIINRQSLFSDLSKESTSASESYEEILIEEIKVTLDSNNDLVKTYRMARDYIEQNPKVEYTLRIFGPRDKDGRVYNKPAASEVGALIVGDFDSLDNRDIIVKVKGEGLQRISELHPKYLALQYPILFPYGEDGYRTDILHRGLSEQGNNKRGRVTMREFFAYLIQDRDNIFSLILNSRRLFQQFLVDAYTMIESERLYYILREQKVIRCETYENLIKCHDSGQFDVSNVGQKIILPSSFTGGQRYKTQNYLDAMSLCKWYGYPDLFITVTCNQKWPEIKRFLKDTKLNADDRPDILCRIFKIKLDAIMKDLMEKQIFGKVAAVVYTIEFQKRGLPHAHICLFMHVDHKLNTVDDIDRYISAEIPNKDEDPELYSIVSDYMMHGPCGLANPKCPCMVNRKCSKHFPKEICEETKIDEDGYPVYRRRVSINKVEKSGVMLDNTFVVPYNKYLLKKYQAHINVEWCNQAGSIKYLFKYINKGPDRATFEFVAANKETEEEAPKNEIKEYYDCRYVSACEAAWRIFSFDIHHRQPSVIRLPFHLPGKQSVVYGSNDTVEEVINKPSVASNMFLSWMKCNQTYEAARELSYVEFPTKFVWKQDKRCWQPRKQGFSVGRIHSVSAACGEAYFLRILLNKVRGPTCFDDIKTVDGIIYPTFRDACYARGLLDDDNEFIEAIKEASFSGTGHYLRNLFSAMLLTNTLSIPEFVWNNTWTYLSEDIVYQQKQVSHFSGFTLTEEEIKNLTLLEIEKFLLSNNSSLRRFETMPFPEEVSFAHSRNRLINDELSYDISFLENECHNLINSLTDEQRYVFDHIMKSVESNEGGVFFVYGYGGTGKTFLWKTLSSYIRSQRKIVINVASSGIASLLLSGGRTAHSKFHIPINLHEQSLCSIKPSDDTAQLLRQTQLIIWDEAPMTHKHAYEAFDRSMRDIVSSASSKKKLPFGGKTIVFGGDFRQVLPVVQNGTRQEIVNASLCSSFLWKNCKVLKLTKNMRLTIGNEQSDMETTKQFASWLLDLGEGNIGDSDDGDSIVEIPDDILIDDTVDPLASLIEFVYPSILINYKNKDFFSDGSILAPTNEYVHEINNHLISIFPGEEKEYLSSDSICPTEELRDDFDPSLYSPDVLNGLKISGFPNHRLLLKVGVPVMLLRNIDQQNGLCNGTRLKIISLGQRVIEAEIISGGQIGLRTFIPRINMIPSDKRIAFNFQRRQFPISLCFAMTINKSQGQSLSRVGLYLKEPVFSHGQLYVALSRVKSREGVKLLILDKNGEVSNKTSNIVYKEIFSYL